MFLKEFKDLRRKRDKLRGLPDQLNYAIPIDDYTIALKDGAFLSAFDCSGLDLNSASIEELDAHRAQGNRALARLDDGFQYNIDLIRYPSIEYSARTFPDPVSAALDREREIQYSAEGQHFETRCVLTITYRPPANAQTRIAGVFSLGCAERYPLEATTQPAQAETPRVRRCDQSGAEADRAPQRTPAKSSSAHNVTSVVLPQQEGIL